MNDNFYEDQNEILFSGYRVVNGLRKYTINHIGEFAKEFIARLGMIAATEDGEDSSGRAKVRLSTPTELVQRAIETAELFYKTIDEKGYSNTKTLESLKDFLELK